MAEQRVASSIEKKMVLEESELVSGKYYVSEGIMVARGEITEQQKEAMLQHNQVPRRMIIAGPFDSREEAKAVCPRPQRLRPYIWKYDPPRN